MVERDDKTWDWCPYRENEKQGYVAGLYVTHTIENCKAVKRQKKDNITYEEKTKTANPSSSSSKLSVSNNLNAVLTTRYPFSVEEVEALLSVD